MLVFVIGLIVGGTLGMMIMCLVSADNYNKGYIDGILSTTKEYNDAIGGVYEK